MGSERPNPDRCIPLYRTWQVRFGLAFLKYATAYAVVTVSLRVLS